MSEDSRFVDVSLFGKDYSVACPPKEHDNLRASVALVDARMREIAQRTRSSSTERIAVMVALNLAHEHLVFRQEQERLAQAAAEEAAAAKQTGLDFEEVRRRIESMESLLDAVIESPEKVL